MIPAWMTVVEQNLLDLHNAGLSDGFIADYMKPLVAPTRRNIPATEEAVRDMLRRLSERMWKKR